jgi:hypothetical protein
MKTNLNKTLLAALSVLAMALPLAQAEPYAAGSEVKAFSLNDQYGSAYTYDAKATRYILVSHDMETGKAANAALTGLGKEYLPGKNAVFISNIHGMPGIGRMFALRKMKKYTHRILLGEDAAFIGNFPSEAGKVTVLKLSRGKVVAVSYWNPAEDLGLVLK